MARRNQPRAIPLVRPRSADGTVLRPVGAVTRVELTLDGRDLEPRRGDGELVIFVQITDSGGNQYQHHHVIDLAKLDENIRSSNLEYLQRAFVLPGDYQVAAAIFDTRSGDGAGICSFV